MKTTNNGSLLDFYREEGRHLDLMNAFMTRFQKENVIYVCGVVKGYIPGNKLALYHRRFRGKI